MKQIQLSEQLSISAIVQGFWRLESWNWTAKELADFMKACIKRGVTTFDTAQIYADTRCESLWGRRFPVIKA